MKSLVGTTFVLGLAAVLAALPPAAGAQKPDKDAPKTPFPDFFTFPKWIKLDKKQEEQLAELRKKYTPRLAALHKKYSAVMTKARVKAADAARQKAEAAGKDEKEVVRVYREALRLTGEEEKTLKEVGEEQGRLMKEIQEKRLAVLTAKQKELLNSKPKPKPKPKDKDKDKEKDKKG
jgi:hypothetical protein